jgi:Fic family protein
MNFIPIAPTKMNGEFDDSLIEWAGRICAKSAALAGSHNSAVLNEIRELLRIINSYYSNLIESDGTHPSNIEKAMKQEFSKDEKNNKLQKLSVAHIHVQRLIENDLVDNSVFDSDFIRFVHREMYSQDGMDQYLNIFDKDTGETVQMIPGEFRTHDVAVGKYNAPEFGEVNGLMSQYAHLYGLEFRKELTAKKLIYALASHHRLVWIHPFLDGNGRVSRLVLDGAISSCGISGYGLWNISRGLARSVEAYKENLRHADMLRQGQYDGKGDLSAGALRSFVEYMLTIAEDQIDYMNSLLKMDGLTTRLENYVAFANKRMLGIEELPKGSAQIFKYLLIHGESQRGSMTQVIGAGERTTTKVVQELLKREFLSTPSPKGPIHLRFPAHMASYVFPDLMPVLSISETIPPKRKAGRPTKVSL